MVLKNKAHLLLKICVERIFSTNEITSQNLNRADCLIVSIKSRLFSIVNLRLISHFHPTKMNHTCANILAQTRISVLSQYGNTVCYVPAPYF